MKAPRLARWLIGLSVPAARRDDALGDLEETWRRRRPAGRVRASLGSIGEAVVITVVELRERLRSIGPGRLPATWPDLRLAARLMYRQPFVTITATVALAVGMALATAGFAMTEALLWSRLPFDPERRWVRLDPIRLSDGSPATLSPDDYERLASVAALSHVGGVMASRVPVTRRDGAVVLADAAGLTPSSTASLPWTVRRGRLFGSSDGRPGAAPVVLLRESFATSLWPSIDDALGATVSVAGVSHTVAGVVGDDARFPNSPDLWMPIDETFLHGRGRPRSDVRLFGVLAAGSTVESARAELDVAASQSPGDPAAAGPARIDIRPFTDLGPMATPMATAVVFVTVAILAVIAANVGNLILARSFQRSHEFALRSALGASRSRLVAQVVVEVFLIAGTSAAVGVPLARLAMGRFNRMDELPFWVDFRGGFLTFALVAGASLLAVAIAGAWPALRATRRDLAGVLQAGYGRTTDVQFGRAAGAVTVLQIAVSVVMLHGAIVVLQGLSRYTGSGLALPANVLTTAVSLNAVRTGPDAALRTPLRAGDVLSAVGAVPGITNVGLATALPRHSPTIATIEFDTGAGRPTTPTAAPWVGVTEGFFPVLDGRLLAGRTFTPADFSPGARPVAVVNEPFVRHVLAGRTPVGRRFREVSGESAGPWREIVGVVSDLGLSVGEPALAGGFYVPLTDDTNFVYIAMRVQGDDTTVTGRVRQALATIDPGLVTNRFERLSDVASEDRAFFAVLSAVLTGVGALTLVLALAGVYAMMALIVSRRTREIGVRLALGASSSRIIRTVLGRAATQVVLGGVIGAALAWLSLDARAVLVSRLGDGGAWALPGVLVLLLVSGITATWIPLRRALRVAPIDALRHD